jgi:hypothetical protein
VCCSLIVVMLSDKQVDPKQIICLAITNLYEQSSEAVSVLRDISAAITDHIPADLSHRHDWKHCVLRCLRDHLQPQIPDCRVLREAVAEQQRHKALSKAKKDAGRLPFAVQRRQRRCSQCVSLARCNHAPESVDSESLPAPVKASARDLSASQSSVTLDLLPSADTLTNTAGNDMLSIDRSRDVGSEVLCIAILVTFADQRDPATTSSASALSGVGPVQCLRPGASGTFVSDLPQFDELAELVTTPSASSSAAPLFLAKAGVSSGTLPVSADALKARPSPATALSRSDTALPANTDGRVMRTYGTKASAVARVVPKALARDSSAAPLPSRTSSLPIDPIVLSFRSDQFPSNFIPTRLGIRRVYNSCWVNSFAQLLNRIPSVVSVVDFVRQQYPKSVYNKLWSIFIRSSTECDDAIRYIRRCTGLMASDGMGDPAELARKFFDSIPVVGDHLRVEMLSDRTCPSCGIVSLHLAEGEPISTTMWPIGIPSELSGGASDIAALVEWHFQPEEVEVRCPCSSKVIKQQVCLRSITTQGHLLLLVKDQKDQAAQANIRPSLLLDIKGEEYELYAIVLHRPGHFLFEGRDNDDVWRRYDDETVSIIDSSALSHHGRLFYYRRRTPSTIVQQLPSISDIPSDSTPSFTLAARPLSPARRRTQLRRPSPATASAGVDHQAAVSASTLTPFKASNIKAASLPSVAPQPSSAISLAGAIPQPPTKDVVLSKRKAPSSPTSVLSSVASSDSDADSDSEPAGYNIDYGNDDRGGYDQDHDIESGAEQDMQDVEDMEEINDGDSEMYEEADLSTYMDTKSLPTILRENDHKPLRHFKVDQGTFRRAGTALRASGIRPEADPLNLYHLAGLQIGPYHQACAAVLSVFKFVPVGSIFKRKVQEELGKCESEQPRYQKLRHLPVYSQ